MVSINSMHFPTKYQWNFRTPFFRNLAIWVSADKLAVKSKFGCLFVVFPFTLPTSVRMQPGFNSGFRRTDSLYFLEPAHREMMSRWKNAIYSYQVRTSSFRHALIKCRIFSSGIDVYGHILLLFFSDLAMEPPMSPNPTKPSSKCFIA